MKNDLLYYLIIINVFLNVIYHLIVKKYIFDYKKNILISDLIILVYLLIKEMGTYKDFLQTIGVSHGVFMIILIVLFLIASFIVMLYKLGLITKIKFGLIVLSKSQIVYTNFSGSFEIVNTKVQ